MNERQRQPPECYGHYGYGRAKCSGCPAAEECWAENETQAQRAMPLMYSLWEQLKKEHGLKYAADWMVTETRGLMGEPTNASIRWNQNDGAVDKAPGTWKGTGHGTPLS